MSVNDSYDETEQELTDMFDVEQADETDEDPDMDLDIDDIFVVDSSCTDSIKLYLKEIGRYDLLTPQQEIELAKKKDLGDSEARKRLIESNLRLVVKIAKQYHDSGLDFLDLIQAGNIGLLKGIDKYDYRKGFRISTYVTYLIKKEIREEIDNHGSMIRISVHTREQYRRIIEAKNKFMKEMRKEPSSEELSAYLENTISARRIDKVVQLCSAVTHIKSIDEPIGDDDDGRTYKDTIEDKRNEPVSDELPSVGLKDIIKKELDNTLDFIEYDIFMYKWAYEIFGVKKKDDSTIGEEWNISQKEVSAYEASAMKKVRENSRLREIYR